MTSEHDRRRFLQLTGTGTAAALAGCSDLGLLGDDGGEYDDVLTAVIGPDSAEIEGLQEQVENEEIDMMEAQQRQQELVEESIDDFESRAEEDDITIEDSSPEYGLFRIDGEAEAIVDELKGGPIASLSEGAAYDRILEEQEQQPDPTDPEEDIDVEEEPEDDEAGDEELEEDEADGDDEENGADDGEEPADEDEDPEDLETEGGDETDEAEDEDENADD